MLKPYFRILAALLILAGAGHTLPDASAAPSGRPNVVLILADDYGAHDAGCYGSDGYLTPNIDRLAADGVRFTQAYSACTVCSPSRAALLTGKSPARLHLTDWIPGLPPENPKLLVPDWTKTLLPEEVTLARLFKEAGYATALIGKWHLGEGDSAPEKLGFDVNKGGTGEAHPSSYFSPYRIETLPDGPAGEYLTDRLGEEAVRFIEDHRNAPFFLFLSHFAVHTPIQAKKPRIAAHRARLRDGATTQTNAAYAAMIESMDETVGRVRARLKELGLEERTVIVFASDNGGRIPTTSNRPLRAGKGSCYEGGTRVPFIVYWPGVTRPGMVCDTPTIGMDIFPTVLEMAGLPVPAPVDGRSLVPLLRGTGAVEREALFWHYPHYQHYQQEGTTPYGAVRAGDYKLIEFFDDMRVELYNLSADPGEQHDLAARMPEKVEELRARLHAWRRESGAQMPSPNPRYDPSRPEHDPRTRARKRIALVPEKMAAAVADLQDAQIPDRVRLTGWVGARIDANASNRLVKLDPARLLEGYRKRPGRQKWDGEHVGKWLHAASLAWVNTGDEALRQKLDYVAAELARCQLPDGYLGTYTEDKRWTEWDVWSHKYNLLGLITYMRHTGNLEPLPTCRRMADLLCRTFGDAPGKRDLIPSGQHMGMASTSVLEPMILLYRLTGEKRYLNFCRYILRTWEQPNGPKIVSTLLESKRVDQVGNAKAYEMLSCLNGALEFYRTTGERQLLDACLIAWQDIVDNRLYPTGAASYREFFHGDFDFPNQNNVGETCVTVTWLQFNAQLLRLTGEARFAEQLEKVVLNQLMGAQCPDGSAWGYYVQMEGRNPYNGTLDAHCCLSSGPRGVALIPTFAVTTDADGVVVNLYDAGVARLGLRDGTRVNITADTRYPAEDPVILTLMPEKKHAFALKLRVPEWSRNFVVVVNGEAARTERGADGYHAVRRVWQKGDRVELRFHPEPRLLVGDHKNENKVALLYGPLVLAADESLLELDARESTGPGVWAVGVAGPELEGLSVARRPAEGAFRTWAGAQVFTITGVAREALGGRAAGTTMPVGLVPFADAGAGGGRYRVWLPWGRPRPDRNLLLDGIENRSRKPQRGSIIDDDPGCVASTQSGRRAAEDWFSVELVRPVTIGRIVFVHGRTLPNGGWFDTSEGKPRLEIRKDPEGPWVLLARLESYPDTTAREAGGLRDGDRFSVELPEAVEIHGLRVIGKPACGANPKQAFATCGELQAFAP